MLEVIWIRCGILRLLMKVLLQPIQQVLFTLTNTAPYLIIYSERFATTDVTNNERIEGQGRIRLNGTTDLIEGAGEGYIRKV